MGSKSLAAAAAKRKARLPKSEEEEEPKFQSPPIILPSDEDDADADLSLKIVQKSILKRNPNPNPSSSSSSVPDVKKKIKPKKKKNKVQQDNASKPIDIAVETKLDDADAPKQDAASKQTLVTPVDDTKPKQEDALKQDAASKQTLVTSVVDDIKPKQDDDDDDAIETNTTDNAVLRKLLRGPRYFDPPDNSWGNCYNCGEAGHAAVNCTSAKRRKPCFVCGSLEHNAKQCNKGKDCFICKKGGHRAKDCPDKSNWGAQIAKICLKCGDSGHEMFTCKSKYSSDDLKEIQCYICKSFGHLCCMNYAGEGPIEVSCYRCGQSGHSGWECARVHSETTSNGTPSSCFKCGEEGHMARKCTSSVKKDKRKSEFSSPRKSRSRDNYGSHVGVRSVPPDLGNARKRSKTQYGQPSSSQQKQRGRGGWITEDPGDYNNSNHGWGGSPKTPTRFKSNDRYHGGSGYKSNVGYHTGNVYNSGYNNSGFHSNRGKFQYDSTVGSSGYQQRFSASRFGNSSSYGKREFSWEY